MVCASHRGNTALKAVEKFKDLSIEIVAVTVNAGAKAEVVKEWEGNIPKMESVGIKLHHGTHSFSGVERAVKERWGMGGPALLVGDVLRVLGEGTKVCIEVLLMAADAGLVQKDEKVMAIAGTSRGCDTCLVVKATTSTKFFDLAIQEIVCKPYSEGVKHVAG